MNTIEVRSLLTNKNIDIQIPQDIVELFKIWKNLRQESYNKSIEPEEIFYAGYILSNPMVKEQYRKFKKENKM